MVELGITIAELYYRAADLRSSNPDASRILRYTAEDLERPGSEEDVRFREALLSDEVLSAIELSLHSKH